MKNAEKVLDELEQVRPEKLTGEAKRLFEAIMKIADERDELLKERQADKEKIKELNEGLDNSSSRVTALTRENTKLKHEVFNSIPKAIIEDKIEELKHKDFIKLQLCYQHDNKVLVQIEVLEELLKDGGE